MYFCELTIHQKITLRGNVFPGHCRHILGSWYNYHLMPLSHYSSDMKYGNLKMIKHNSLNRKSKRSGETLKWMYGCPERKVDHSTVEFNKKTERREHRVLFTETIAATVGAYGYAGIKWWNLPVMPIKKRRAIKTIQHKLFEA